MGSIIWAILSTVFYTIFTIRYEPHTIPLHNQGLQRIARTKRPLEPAVRLWGYVLKSAFIVILLTFFLCNVAKGQEISHETMVFQMPGYLIEMFAAAQKPNKNGAIGRNRHRYFHVRFQYRMHHLADYALRNRSLEATQYFIRSLEYALEHQNNEGGFELNIPPELKSEKPPSNGDIASGVAFFIASAASGVLSLDQSNWFRTSRETEILRAQLKKSEKGLKKAGEFLFKKRKLLITYDAKAPNRLFFDALAFHALGIYFQMPKMTRAANQFIQLALEQQDDKGYFIEGGGYDSSYNGVAIAVGYRLLLFHPDNKNLSKALEKAVYWQESRVSNSGEICLEGNSRVFVGGESFLGKEKGVDVSHVVEGFALASVVTENKRFLEISRKIINAYAPQKKRGEPVTGEGPGKWWHF